MTRKDIGRIGVAFGISLGIAGCSELHGQPSVSTAAVSGRCSYVGTDNRTILCTSYTLIDTRRMTATVCSDTSGVGVGGTCH